MPDYAVFCPGNEPGGYCDCSGDCTATEHSYCECEEAAACCAAAYASPDPSPDPSPSPEAAFAGCVDTDNGATDVDGYGCADYTGYYYYYAGYSYTSYSEDCTSRDDDDSNAPQRKNYNRMDRAVTSFYLPPC